MIRVVLGVFHHTSRTSRTSRTNCFEYHQNYQNFVVVMSLTRPPSPKRRRRTFQAHGCHDSDGKKSQVRHLSRMGYDLCKPIHTVPKSREKIMHHVAFVTICIPFHFRFRGMHYLSFLIGAAFLSIICSCSLQAYSALSHATLPPIPYYVSHTLSYLLTVLGLGLGRHLRTHTQTCPDHQCKPNALKLNAHLSLNKKWVWDPPAWSRNLTFIPWPWAWAWP